MRNKTVVESTVTQKVKHYSEIDLNEVADGDQEMVQIPVGMLHLLLNCMEYHEPEDENLNVMAKKIDDCR